MDASPYYAPTYFPASYFYAATASAPISTPTGVLPYNAPTYFAPSYFYGTSTTSTPTGLLPYNAPTYFAPAYFYGPSSTSAPTGLLPYNAPTYFAPTYFYGPSSTTAVVPVTPTPIVINQDPYLELLASLQAIGLFEEVIFGAATQRSQAGADTYPLAVLTPKGWEESDDYDPTSIVRRVTFSITVVVKSEDDLPQFEALDQLSTAIKKAVDGSSLDGTCLPALTRIRSGHFVYSNHYPEQSIELEGEFSSIINPTSSS
jgi:hypothetical protein